MSEKIPLSGLGGQIIHTLRGGPPPLNSLSELGFSGPESTPDISVSTASHDKTTFWGPYGWQPTNLEPS